MGFDVIVCGSLHLDIVVKAKALPRIDETAVGSAWSQVCGGKGGNQALQAAKAGAKTAMIGRIGSDDFGNRLSDSLGRAGVDITQVTRDASMGSGMSVAILQDNGDYGAVIVSGANTALDPLAVEHQWRDLGGGKVLVLQNEIPIEVNKAAAKVAASQGALVVLNAAPARDLDPDFLEDVAVLIVNRIEAEAMTGQAVTDFKTAKAALSKLRRPKRSVVITLGGGGLVVAPAQGPAVDIPAIKVKVTSTHGAGDCFVGHLAAELAAGRDLVDACHFANQRAALFVSGAEDP